MGTRSHGFGIHLIVLCILNVEEVNTEWAKRDNIHWRR